MLDPWHDMAYKIFALFILFASVAVIVVGIITIHELPYKIARKRGHLQQEAIRCMSIMGLVLFPLWLLAMIWAYMKPVRFAVRSPDDSPQNPDEEALTSQRAAGEEKPSSADTDATKDGGK